MRVLVAYGTRPERIKLEPLIAELTRLGVDAVEWCSGQQKDLVTTPTSRSVDWKHGVAHGIACTLTDLGQLLGSEPFDAVIVQGDTATAFAAAQAAFLAQVPVAHVEAGMRTYAAEPFPEEAFRRQIAAVARWHFCPDAEGAHNVYREIGRPAGEGGYFAKCGIHVTGNTVIDTLPRQPFKVLATLHRRENWGPRIKNAIASLKEAALRLDISVELVRHPNWAVHQTELPDEDANFRYIPPQLRDDLLQRLQAASLVVTDSGGLQEEAAHFGVPCVVLRTTTERTGLERAGAIELAHPDTPGSLTSALETHVQRRRVYGRGDASSKIAQILVEDLRRGPAGGPGGPRTHG